MKSNVRKRAAEHRAEIEGTGGGPCKKTDLKPTELRVLAIIGKESALGDTSTYIKAFINIHIGSLGTYQEEPYHPWYVEIERERLKAEMKNATALSRIADAVEEMKNSNALSKIAEAMQKQTEINAQLLEYLKQKN